MAGSQTAAVHRGEIWPLVGMPGDTANKPGRPVVIVSRDHLNNGDSVVAVPFYSQQLDRRKGLRSCVFFNSGDGGLGKDCVAKCDEISRIDKTELDFKSGRRGKLNAVQMERIVKAIRYVIRDEE